MIIKCYNENHPYLLFIDLEFFTNKDESAARLVQFAGLLFKWIDDETYQLMRSCNEYVTEKVCYPFAEYTSITSNFLAENGIPLKDMVASIKEDFLKDIPLNELLVISHGLRNDRLVMVDNGLNLSIVDGMPIDGYCTFENARKILQRTYSLTLADLAEECGYYLHHAHNAYNDVWAEVAVFTYLKKYQMQKTIEEEEERNKLLKDTSWANSTSWKGEWE